MQVKTGDCDYTTVTELPGAKASHEQLARLYTRYKFASEYCKGKDVVEVACGAGIGLGFLAKHAKSIVGGDINGVSLTLARETYKGRDNLKVLPLDAHDLPFDDKSIDVVILYEAIYYLQWPQRFLYEAKRVLRDDGVLMICTANKDWPGFNPSPFSHNYFSAGELYVFLGEEGFDVELFADSQVVADSVLDKSLSIIKKSAVKLHLIPTTMKGKEKLKRLFLGRLLPLPQEVNEDMGMDYNRPVPISYNGPNAQFKVLFAVARVKRT